MCNNQLVESCNCGCNDRSRDNCRRDCSRFIDDSKGACKELEFDFQIARCGIKDIRSGISHISRGCLCEGIQCIKMGICNLQKAAESLISKFENDCIEVGCKTERLVDEAICSIEKGIEILGRGLEAIEEGCIREGLKLLEKGLAIVEEGLSDLAEALRNIC